MMYEVSPQVNSPAFSILEALLPVVRKLPYSVCSVCTCRLRLIR
jgi:hypothetical protein